MRKLEKEVSAKFLLVDDDQVFIMSLQRTMRKMKIVNDHVTAEDGGAAMDVLRNALEQGDGALPPFVILLDVHMPRVDGWDFLEELEEEEALWPLGLFVFATPEIKDRMQTRHGNKISGFLSKDAPVECFEQALCAIRQPTPPSHYPYA